MHLLLAMTLLAAAPDAGASATAPTHASYVVYWKELPVLRLTDEPGPLLSTALPPPGWSPPQHPFLSGQALDAAHESELRKLLDDSKSLDDYLARLRKAGYRIEPAK